MQIHNLIQGSPEWVEFRLTHNGASEAAAMLGLSKHMTRNELLRLKKTGMEREFSDYVRRKILEKGHAVEAPARKITEEDLGEELYAVTGSEGKLSCSFDGLTLAEDRSWEHKQWSEALAASIRAGVLPEEHMPQVQQNLMLSKAEFNLFTVSDGTREKRETMRVYPDPAWFDRILAGWAQFEKDLVAFEHAEVIEPPRAEPVADLPAVTVQVRGELTMCNLKDVTPKFDRFLAEAKLELKTDEDFALAEAQSKKGREVAKQCRLTAKAVVDQMATVAEVTRSLEDYAAKFDAVALRQEKAVTQQKELRKTNAKLERDKAYADHIAALNDEIAPLRLVLADADRPNFTEVMKAQRTLASLYNKLDTELARVKIAADAAAAAIRAKRTWYLEAAKGFEHLFADLQGLINRGDMEFFQLAVNNRINDHKAAEEKRREDERARIQAEEKAKAEAAIAETLRAIESRTQAVMAAAEAQRQADLLAPQTEKPAAVLSPVAPSPAPAASDATINLGQINERLAGVKVDVQFLERKGFHYRMERGSELFREADLPRIYAAIIDHVQAIAAAAFRAAA